MLLIFADTKDNAAAGVILVMFVLFFFFVIAMVGLVIWLILSQSSRAKKRQAAISEYAAGKGYGFSGQTTWTPAGSYSYGTVSNLMSGTLATSKNKFWCYDQTEVRGSGKSRTTYYRTVMLTTIPDVVSHFIVNSKLNNNQMHGSNLHIYDTGQKFSLEGDFSEFFDVLAPKGHETDIVNLLAPNTMEYMLEELTNYDFEIVSGHLYVYHYSHLDITKIDELLNKIDVLSSKLKLRVKDARRASAAQKAAAIPDEIARTATDNFEHKKLAKAPLKSLTAVALLFILVFTVGPMLPIGGKQDLIMPIAVILVVIVSAVAVAVSRSRTEKLKKRLELRNGKK